MCPATNLNTLTVSGYPLLSTELEETEDVQQEAALLTKWQRIMGINYEIVVGWLALPASSLEPVSMQKTLGENKSNHWKVPWREVKGLEFFKAVVIDW